MSQPSGTCSVNQPWGSVSTGMASLLYDLARPRAGEGGPADDRLAPHQHVADAHRELHRVLEGGAVGHRVRVEHDDVGALSLDQLADAAQGKGPGRLRGELADGLLEGHHS